MINFKLWEQLFQEIDEPLIFIKQKLLILEIKFLNFFEVIKPPISKDG